MEIGREEVGCAVRMIGCKNNGEDEGRDDEEEDKKEDAAKDDEEEEEAEDAMGESEEAEGAENIFARLTEFTIGITSTFFLFLHSSLESIKASNSLISSSLLTLKIRRR